MFFLVKYRQCCYNAKGSWPRMQDTEEDVCHSRRAAAACDDRTMLSDRGFAESPSSSQMSREPSSAWCGQGWHRPTDSCSPAESEPHTGFGASAICPSFHRHKPHLQTLDFCSTALTKSMLVEAPDNGTQPRPALAQKAHCPGEVCVEKGYHMGRLHKPSAIPSRSS